MILGVGTFGMLLSAPGQTVGVSVFTDSLIESLGISRSALSLAYLIGTLSSALVLSRAGRAYDRRGGRLVGTAAAIGLAITLVGLSFSARLTGSIARAVPALPQALIGIVVITIGFFLLRFTGQGILTLASRNMVMEWFEQRRGLANGIMGVSISFGFSIAPRVFEAAIQGAGWEGAWRIIALVVGTAAGVLFLLYRDRPEDHGMVPDGSVRERSRTHHPETEAAADFTAAQARRTYAFWLFATALFMASLIGTAYTFHIVSIFDDAGLSRELAVSVFFPASVVAVALQFAGSWLSDRIKLKYLAAFQLAGLVTLSAGIVALRHGGPVFIVILGQGMMQGMFGVTSNLTWPRFFGRRHLGAISGLAMAFGVGGSAVGPYFFSFGRDVFGSYDAPVVVCGVIVLVLFVGAFFAEKPAPPTEP